MTNASVTFGLEIGYYDSVAEADAGKEVILATPRLEVFFSASIAAAKNEGINQKLVATLFANIRPSYSGHGGTRTICPYRSFFLSSI